MPGPSILTRNLNPGLQKSGLSGKCGYEFRSKLAGRGSFSFRLQRSLLRRPRSRGKGLSEGVGRAIARAPGWNFTDRHGQREAGGSRAPQLASVLQAGPVRSPTPPVALMKTHQLHPFMNMHEHARALGNPPSEARNHGHRALCDNESETTEKRNSLCITP
nr:uncharacterized protein LOC129473134 [Symphalangus syndactylus]